MNGISAEARTSVEIAAALRVFSEKEPKLWKYISRRRQKRS